MPALLPGSWENRLERLRPTWRERGEKLERLLRAARVVLPVTLSVEAYPTLMTTFPRARRVPMYRIASGTSRNG